MNSATHNGAHTMKIQISARYGKDSWGYAGMTVRLYWTGLRFGLRSARGSIVYGSKEAVSEFARSNFWNLAE
jgi:hypothetical protein